jgi:hypothetical protein
MLVVKGLIECQDRLVRIRIVNSRDSPLFAFTRIIACRGDSDFLSNLPVDRFGKGNLGASSLNSGVEQGPSWRAFNAV